MRKSRLGPYCLLLEEIATLLPINQAAESQQALLLFELLLEKVKDSSPQWHDLAARTFVVQGQLWFRYGDPGRAREEYRKALYHKGRGTGEEELHATILASQGELLHASEPSKAIGKMVRALNLVEDLPLRKVELLWQLASMHIQRQEFGEAWQLLLDVEDLADEHAHYLLETIWQLLMEVETRLVQFGDGRKRILYHSLGHYHARCLGCIVPAHDSTRELSGGLQLTHELVPARLEVFCLSWSAGFQVCEDDCQEMQQFLAFSKPGRESFGALHEQLTDLWVRYPNGRLANDFLEPLVGYLARLCPPN